eukprot:scaffold78424_cov39-Cyclotella_meneghiniana.AAC.1
MIVPPIMHVAVGELRRGRSRIDRGTKRVSDANSEGKSKAMRCRTWAGVLTNAWRWRPSCQCNLHRRFVFRPMFGNNCRRT